MRMTETPADTPANSASAPDTAVLLVNLGTPDAPTAPAVRRYLAEFLHDYRVVALSRWIWCPLLHFVILPLRSGKVARKYAGIWIEGDAQEGGGSPLAVHTRDLAAAMQARAPRLRVDWAMRYGRPSVASRLAALRDAGVRRVLVLPLYPQYSTTTTASVEDAVAAALAGPVQGLQAQVIADYHVDPGWVEAVAASIRRHWDAHGRADRLLFSFHGIPQRLARAGDPYPQHCEAGARAIVQALGIDPAQTLTTFQSRFGREPWLQPYTDETLAALPAQGVKTVDVVCPGFAVDCLETLEEIAIENDEVFREAGGRALRYIPCLNAEPAHAEALVALAQSRLEAWA